MKPLQPSETISPMPLIAKLVSGLVVAQIIIASYLLALASGFSRFYTLPWFQEIAVYEAISRKPERHEFLEMPAKLVRFMNVTGG